MPYSDIQQRKREIRTQIGRIRRRINTHLNATRREGRQLVSWRQYVTRYPIYAMLAAFGVGLAASAGSKRGQLLRKLGLQAARHAAESVGQRLWREFQQVWSQSGVQQ